MNGQISVPAKEETPVGTPTAPARVPRAPGKLLALAGESRILSLVGVLAVLAVIGAVTEADTFLTRSNVINILTTASVIGIVTVGMTFVIIGGGIDLSVGAIIALASVWSTTVATQDLGLAAMVFTALVVGAGAGLINGALIAYGRLVPFIVTLAMLASARGLAEQMSNRRSQVVEVNTFADIALAKWLGIPMLVYILAVVCVLGWILLNRTTFGRRTYAVGGNPEAARLAGINVRRHTALLYLLSGLCCGIAAVMLTAQTNTGASTHGTLYELDAIAAVIIGGTLLSGGRGSLIGSILGVLIFTTITNLFILNNLSTPIQNIAKGAIIVAAVLLQRRGRARSS
ncbi:ABC transporter permease [Parafrankia elaeagni]|uniref:ABC transporter permease n=1 Tax=Parafrankia elaeagni TaxID=222534 RepID=UPI00036B21DB|nr:ABC transporter permease [Parafrankia elaeagni]